MELLWPSVDYNNVIPNYNYLYSKTCWSTTAASCSDKSVKKQFFFSLFNGNALLLKRTWLRSHTHTHTLYITLSPTELCQYESAFKSLHIDWNPKEAVYLAHVDCMVHHNRSFLRSTHQKQVSSKHLTLVCFCPLQVNAASLHCCLFPLINVSAEGQFTEGVCVIHTSTGYVVGTSFVLTPY